MEGIKENVQIHNEKQETSRLKKKNISKDVVTESDSNCNKENVTANIKSLNEEVDQSEKKIIKEEPIINHNFVNPEIVDSSEDSGLGSLVGTVEGTIGDGIQFVKDPKLHPDNNEKSLQEKKQEAEQKRLAREAYEAEIRDQQYLALMHLLKQSKALSTFIVKKFETQKKQKEKKSKPKSSESKIHEDEPETSTKTETRTRGRKRKNSNVLEESPPASRPKRARVPPKKLQSSLNSEEIEEHLANISDNEAGEPSEDETDDVENFVQPIYFEGELRNYQKVGVNWMKVLFENGLSGILADEMGLGKTIQIIALLAYLYERKVAGPHLIIVPLSTLPNWISEFKRFAPKLPVVVYHGNAQTRMNLRSKLSKKYAITETFKTQPIVLVTYQTPYNDGSFLQKFYWRTICIDEAQKIKNSNCQLKRIVQKLRSMNRMLLTGTPLQNNLAELWSLLNFLLPDIFNDLAVFESWFDAKEVQSEAGKAKFFQQEQEKQVIQTLREILHPFMLRRIKEVVCPEIPPIKEVIVYAPLTKLQFDLYQAILNRDIEKLYKIKKESIIVDVDGKRPKRKCTQAVNVDVEYNMRVQSVENEDNLDDIPLRYGGAIGKESDTKLLSEWSEYCEVNNENCQYFLRLKFGNTMYMYKHVVNHPYLLHYPLNDCNLPLIDENIMKTSGKLLVLDVMLKKLHARGHKVLLFATTRMVLDIIEDYITLTNFKYVRLDGSIRLEERDENIYNFNNNPEIFLFLITTRAGSVGLNLMAADTVIIYDSDWNPQCDLQAMARCHRIGQSKPVVVYRLCTKGTIDEEVIKRAQTKRFLEKAVISKKGDLDCINKDGLKKLKMLLEENEYSIVNSKSDVYTEEELDEILDRSDLEEMHKNKLKELNIEPKT